MKSLMNKKPNNWVVNTTWVIYDKEVTGNKLAFIIIRLLSLGFKEYSSLTDSADECPMIGTNGNQKLICRQEEPYIDDDLWVTLDEVIRALKRIKT